MTKKDASKLLPHARPLWRQILLEAFSDEFYETKADASPEEDVREVIALCEAQDVFLQRARDGLDTLMGRRSTALEPALNGSGARRPIDHGRFEVVPLDCLPSDRSSPALDWEGGRLQIATGEYIDLCWVPAVPALSSLADEDGRAPQTDAAKRKTEVREWLEKMAVQWDKKKLPPTKKQCLDQAQADEFPWLTEYIFKGIWRAAELPEEWRAKGRRPRNL